MTVEDPPDIGPLCLLSAPASDARIRPLVGSSKTQGEQMPHPDRIVVDTISVSPVDSRGNRGEQRYWRAKKGREYLGAQWATRTEARAWALALAQEDLGIAPAGATNVVDLTGLLEAWWEVTETDPLLKAKTTQSYRYSLQHLDDAGGGEKLAGMDVDAMKRKLR